MKILIFLTAVCVSVTLPMADSQLQQIAYPGPAQDAKEGGDAPSVINAKPKSGKAITDPVYPKQAYYQSPFYSEQAYYSGYPYGYQQPITPYQQYYYGQHYSSYPYSSPYQSYSPQGIAHKTIYSKPNEVHYNYGQKGPISTYHGVEKDARVLSSFYELNPEDSSFQYSYETDNGLSSEAQGFLKGENQVIKGSYTAPNQDGKLTKITYTADENGYVPSGEAIPTIPPIIAKSLAYLRSLPPTPESAHVYPQSGKYYSARYGGAPVPV